MTKVKEKVTRPTEAKDKETKETKETETEGQRTPSAHHGDLNRRWFDWRMSARRDLCKMA